MADLAQVPIQRLGGCQYLTEFGVAVMLLGHKTNEFSTPVPVWAQVENNVVGGQCIRLQDWGCADVATADCCQDREEEEVQPSFDFEHGFGHNTCI